jgi:hypothetical protein
MADADVDEKAGEPLFDVLIPPGVPRSIIKDVMGKFDVQLVERRERMTFANMEGDSRDLLAFRGKREIIEQVEKYMLGRLNEFISR